jgi:signal transduction histidine kinase
MGLPHDPASAPAGADGKLAAKLRETEELLGYAQEAGRLGIFEWHIPSGAVHLSPRFLSLYGLDGFDGRFETWHECIFREDRIRVASLIEEALAEGAREINTEFRITRGADEAVRWMEARYMVFYDDDRRPRRAVGINVDVTEQKRAIVQLRAFTESLEDRVRERTRELEAEYLARQKAEESLRQSQKMDAVGRLTGGIAHDFNNLLTIILGGLEVIGRHAAGLPPSPALVRIGNAREMAVQGARRAASLVSRLMAFSRQQPLAPTAVDANKLVAGMSDMLRRTLGEPIELETVLAGELWSIFVDENQLESAILNLAINARDAMTNGGKLTIETANCHLDQAYVSTLTEPVAVGQYVQIAVTDTGMGMNAATAERAFEPFFTTKEVGKGTGLGLSQVYGFVRQSSGHIRIYSEPGEGTTVKIYLPRLFGAVENKAVVAARSRVAPTSTGGECILVVEDDEALRSHATEILRELGYRVLSATNGESALKVLEAHADIALLFTDVVMPGDLNGRQLADLAAARRPEVKVLFTTGYTRNAIIHHGRLDPGVHVITKPYSFEDLALQVRLLLDS